MGVELVSCQASFSLEVLRLPSSFLELGAPLPTCQWDDLTCRACVFSFTKSFQYMVRYVPLFHFSMGWWVLKGISYPRIYIKIGKCLPSTAAWQVMSCVKHGNQGKGDLLICQSSKRRVPTVPVDVVQRLGLSQLHFAASQCPAAKVFCLRELHIFGTLWCSHRHKHEFNASNPNAKNSRQLLWCLVNLPSQLQDVCQTTVAQQSPRMRAAKLLFSLLSSELNNNFVYLLQLSLLKLVTTWHSFNLLGTSSMGVALGFWSMLKNMFKKQIP